MTEDVRLIVLAYTKYGEKSIVLHALSREYGRRGFLVRAVKGSAMSMFLPLNIVEASVRENPKSSLLVADGFSALYPLNGIRDNLSKNAMTMFMSEVLYRVIKDGTNEEGLFDWCMKSIITLDSLPAGGFGNYHIRFLLELASALGFTPAEEDMKPFSSTHLGEISLMVKLPLAEAMLLPLSGASRSEICKDILKYLEYHTESTINIKSLDVLRELFH